MQLTSNGSRHQALREGRIERENNIMNLITSFIPLSAGASIVQSFQSFLTPKISLYSCVRFGGTPTKIGSIQRRLAWPLRKDDTQTREALHILGSESVNCKCRYQI